MPPPGADGFHPCDRAGAERLLAQIMGFAADPRRRPQTTDFLVCKKKVGIRRPLFIDVPVSVRGGNWHLSPLRLLGNIPAGDPADKNGLANRRV